TFAVSGAFQRRLEVVALVDDGRGRVPAGRDQAAGAAVDRVDHDVALDPGEVVVHRHLGAQQAAAQDVDEGDALAPHALVERLAVAPEARDLGDQRLLACGPGEGVEAAAALPPRHRRARALVGRLAAGPGLRVDAGRAVAAALDPRPAPDLVDGDAPAWQRREAERERVLD